MRVWDRARYINLMMKDERRPDRVHFADPATAEEYRKIGEQNRRYVQRNTALGDKLREALARRDGGDNETYS